MLSAIDRIHWPPSNGMPVRYQRNPQTEATQRSERSEPAEIGVVSQHGSIIDYRPLRRDESKGRAVAD
jgi:hypothetical protein